MRICVVAEGSYPYVVGGVSSWIDSMIRSFPDYEFVLLTIITDRSISKKFKYELPENVTEVYEAYLNDYDWGMRTKSGKRTRFSRREHDAIRGLVLNSAVDWGAVFELFDTTKASVDDILMGADFLEIVKELYNLRYPQIVFSDFLWTIRSIYLPMFLILSANVPKADIYHCVSTGYCGLLGAKAKHCHGGRLLVSEHGIYTREREEEILRSDWVKGVYKNIWIEQFRKMSLVTYTNADRVTALYNKARDLQIGLGCPEEKILVTPNGITLSNFANIPDKSGTEDEGYINVGFVGRITPIKDVKTLIRAYSFAKSKVSNLKLWIMGPGDEDEEYAAECYRLVDDMKLSDIVFTGRVDVREYLGRMDFTILTSISEGQPLTILESFGAQKPVISTDVGCCRELIYGSGPEDSEEAGIITHIMNVPELSEAMVTLAESPEKCEQLGRAGYKRIKSRYTIELMKDAYKSIYGELG